MVSIEYADLNLLLFDRCFVSVSISNAHMGSALMNELKNIE